jgi:DNA-binding SARP family transcriptional activator
VSIGSDAISSDTSVAVTMLGSFGLTIAGQPVERWRAGKARCLLQYLLMRPGRVVSRQALQQALWPESRAAQHTSSLKVAVHMLRSILTSATATIADSPDAPVLRIDTHDYGYSIEVHNVWVDFLRFEKLIARAQDSGACVSQAQALKLYHEAAALYSGDFLIGLDMEWADVRREWLRSLMICALEKLAALHLERDDYIGVINSCYRLLEMEPFHEQSYRTLMTIHGRLGQPTQVDRWYRLCVSRLEGGLQVAPSEATRSVYRSSTRALGRPPGGPLDGPRTPAIQRREFPTAI